MRLSDLSINAPANSLSIASDGRLRWIGVRPRFTRFHQNLLLTAIQTEDARAKYRGVVSCLNRHYFDSSSETENAFPVGSWGKSTVIRPPRDIDLYFVLPIDVYHRFQSYQLNRQSALLQEVKGALEATYPNTVMRGDGQVVVVRFESYSVEVVPAIALKNGQFWICNTHDGGSYKLTDPVMEARHIHAADQACNGNLRPLIRMLKAWQANCSVPLKSFQIELLAAEFLSNSPWRLKDYFWFDWLIRDFFVFLRNRVNAFIFVPGTFEPIDLGNDWQSRADTAYQRALKACSYEDKNWIDHAGDEWQKIFGQQIPRTE